MEKLDIIKTLFSLIRASLDDEYNFQAPVEAFTEEDYNQLYKYSRKHDVLHLVTFALQKANLMPKDAELFKKFQQGLLFAVYRVQQIELAQKSAIEILTENGINYILLKGAVIRNYYPESWMRTSYDVDILVKKADFDKAVEAFSQQGYTISKKSAYDILIIAPNDVHIELHFGFHSYSPQKKEEVPVENVWEQAVEKENGEYALTDEMFYYFHTTHMAKHFIIGGCGIKPFADMFVLYKNQKADQENSYIKESGLTTFDQNVRHLFKVWFYDEQHTPITKQMENYIFTGGAYGSLKNKVAVKQLRVGGKKSYILSRLFMDYEVLKGVFPIIKKHKWLTPVFQVVRWFTVITKGKFSWTLKEFMLSSKNTKKDMDETNKFLEETGL